LGFIDDHKVTHQAGRMVKQDISQSGQLGVCIGRIDSLNRELKRRTRVATLFPNDASLLRLVTAVLIEVSEEWETGKRYVTF
jgi:hypothetical protein